VNHDSPQPIDTSAVPLGDDIRALAERLAEHVHDTWALKRRQEGWTYSPQRDDAGKQHPRVVPYAELPESEKEYDRTTTQETLKALLALGYRIRPRAASRADAGALAEEALAKLQQKPEQVVHLLRIYRGPRQRNLWKGEARLYRAFGRALVKAGQPTRGFELVSEGLHHHRDDPELLYLRAWALARGGNLDRAEKYLAELLPLSGLEGRLRVDALSLAGKIPKQRYDRARSAEERTALPVESATRYEEAYQATGSSDDYPAINAATMWLLAGNPEKSRELAARALELVDARLTALHKEGKQADYWAQATRGEALLLLGRAGEAIAEYTKAATLARGNLGDLAAMRGQLLLLRERLAIEEQLLGLFGLGPVVFFVGHMIDPPPRAATRPAQMRFPPTPALEEAVRAAIRQKLGKINPSAGFCSGASGSDLIFAEEMLALGKELHLVLPFRARDFLTTSVDFGLDELVDHRRRFQRVWKQAEVHHGTQQEYLGDDTLFEFVSTFAQGLTLTRAAHLNVEACLLAVRDPLASRRYGGTVHALEDWRDRGHRVEEIDLADLRCQVGPQQLPPWWETAEPTRVQARQSGRRRAVRAVLFSDVKNYSRLQDAQAPAFFDGFLREVGEVVRRPDICPLSCNTWGDGLFLVFHQARDTAHFALALLDRLRAVDFQTFGLPADTTVRIGIHAGPVFPHWDQLIGRQNFFGTHVNRAARIEPVTPPGCVYVSEQFAAMLAVEPDHDFTCAYTETLLIGKKHDRFRCRLYQLLRKGTGNCP
jgi:class 3 adenylate cyclase